MINYTLSKGFSDSDLTNKEFRLLVDEIINNEFTSYLEVGVWHGVNLAKMADLFKNNEKECRIVGFDCFENDPKDDNSHVSGWPAKKIAENNVKDYNVELVTGFTKDINTIFKDEKFDLIFHDANHTFDAVYEDLKKILPLCHSGSRVAAHNSDKDIPQWNYGAKSAIDKLCAEGLFEIIKIEDRSTLLKCLI